MFLDGEIRKLGKKRGRTEINIMLKEGSCTNIHTHTHAKRKYISIIVQHSLCTAPLNGGLNKIK